VAPPPRATGVEKVGLGELTMRIERDPWRLSLLDPTGQPFWSEIDPVAADGLLGPLSYRDAAGDRWRLTRVTDIERTPSGVRLLAATDEPNGRTAHLDLDSLGPRTVRLSFALSDPSWVAAIGQAVEAAADERFLGFGERFGSLDQRGRLLQTWAQDRRDVEFGDATYAPIPFYVSSRGYSLLLESDARSRFDVAATHPQRLAWEIDRPAVSLVLTYGPSARDLVRQNAALTGLPPLPPMWAFGVWKTAVGGEQQVLRDAARLRERGVPASALLVYDAADTEAYLGWPFVGFAGRRMGPYPNLRSLTDSLHATGFKVLAYKNPDLHVRRATRPTPETERYLVRDTSGRAYVHPHHEVAWVDFTNHEAVAWWGRAWRRALVDLGFDGGMLDLGELVPEDARYADGSDGIATHNRYLGLYAQASFEAARAARGDDFVIFARSGSLGAQRYQSLQWSGDQLVTWHRDGIGGLIPAGLSMGISGFPYWHPEIGGFLGVGLPPSSERELWFRWLQLGALSPLMRDQYGEHQGEPVELWSDADTVAAFRTYAELHNSLVPYLYSQARAATETGLPIMRALALVAPEDPRAWAEEQSYTLGDDLLVAPVVEQGARLRKLYLPPGRWIDWWTGQAWEGGNTVTVEAPLDRIPLFVREGAILPLATDFDTLVPSADPSISTWTGALEIRVGAARSTNDRRLPPARFRLYDGTIFETHSDGSSFTLEARSAPAERDYQLRLPAPNRPTGVFLDGAPAGGWTYEGQTVMLSLHAASFAVRVQW
jgi:alpha-D-xyloside xylohydrolase